LFSYTSSPDPLLREFIHRYRFYNAVPIAHPICRVLGSIILLHFSLYMSHLLTTQAWMADWCPSPEERNVIVGVAVSFNYAVDSFANSQSASLPTRRISAEPIVLIYPASEAPNYKVGYKAAAGFCVACLISTGAFKYKDRRLRKLPLDLHHIQ
jgi:hypothetical protein